MPDAQQLATHRTECKQGLGTPSKQRHGGIGRGGVWLWEGGVGKGRDMQCSPGHSEVWILINCTRNEAAYISAGPEHVWKGCWKGGGCLHRRECNLAYIAFHGEAKNASHLVHCDCPASSLHLHHIACSQHKLALGINMWSAMWCYCTRSRQHIKQSLGVC